MLRVGLTGGVGCGKSEVLKMLAESGCRTHDCDRMARELVGKGKPAYRAVLRAFGAAVRRPDGELDRGLLRQMVFKDPAKARRLEKILHPRIRRRMREILQSSERHLGVVVIEVPLLFETKAEKLFDTTVVVTAPTHKRLAWIKARGWTGADLRRVAARQWPLKRKERLADQVIRNRASRRELQAQVVEWLQKIGISGQRLVNIKTNNGG